MKIYLFVITLIILLGISLPFINSTVSLPTIKEGEDFSVPNWVGLTTNSGYFSEESSSSVNINVKVFDVAWKQINPTKNVYSYSATAVVKEMDFPSFSSQNSTTSPFWMRIWNSGVDWAPSWIQSECGVTSIGKDYDGDGHLPIWNSCVWNEIKKMYKYIFQDLNMRADPRLKFIYIPGAFNWCEFDFTEIGNYSTRTGYSYNDFNTWFQTAMQDLVDIFGDYKYKLVYSGEDYPFDVDHWPAAKNLLAKDAVLKGMGIRNGISEIFNFHLSEIPSYGVTIDTATGYLNFNKSWILQSNPNRIIGTENECFNACGFTVTPSSNLFYAIKMSNLKALQMGVNWLYVVKTDSYMTQYPEFYNWIRYSLGKQANTEFNAWATLRNAEDTFWIYEDSLNWPGKPYIKNLERFLTQRDIKGGAYTKNGSKIYKNIYGSSASNFGTSYEGRQTDLSSGNNTISFFVDDDFLIGSQTDIQIKVTGLNLQASTWILNYQNTSNIASTSTVTVTSTGLYYTATFNFSSITFSNSLSGARKADFEIVNTGSKDIEILFVRVIKLKASTSVIPTPTPQTTDTTSSTTSSTSTTGTTGSPTTGTTTSSSGSSPVADSKSDEPNESSKLISSFSIIFTMIVIFSLLFISLI